MDNHKDKISYMKLVDTLIKNCHAGLQDVMSFKVQILDAHLGKFKQNIGAYSAKVRRALAVAAIRTYWTLNATNNECITKA